MEGRNTNSHLDDMRRAITAGITGDSEECRDELAALSRIGDKDSVAQRGVNDFSEPWTDTEGCK